jgi:hypothetical protein
VLVEEANWLETEEPQNPQAAVAGAFISSNQGDTHASALREGAARQCPQQGEYGINMQTKQ